MFKLENHSKSKDGIKPKPLTNDKKKNWNYFQISRALLRYPLYSFGKISGYQQQRSSPYITHGYRSYLSTQQCCKSVLILSNELVNIWTHGGMVFLLMLLMFYDQFHLLPSMQASLLDHFVFLIFSLCSQVCMTSSACYHTFNCHVHERVATKWYAVDIYGITAQMMGCYFIGLFYGFYCTKGIRMFYIISIIVMVAASGVLIMHPKYLSKRWTVYRVTHLSTITIFGILPTIHWCYVSSSYEVKLFLPGVGILYLILAVAMLFFISRFPERVWPGHFNYVGHSHNWWHLFINFAVLHWRRFALAVLQYRVTTSCPLTT